MPSDEIDPKHLVNVTAESFETPALTHPLKFPVPYNETPAGQGNYSRAWNMIQYVFDLPNPRLFPPLAGVSSDDARVLDRYVHSAHELAEGSFLTFPIKLTIRFNQSDVWVENQNFPSNEIVRGFSVMFRQIYSDDELASFNKVTRILGRVNQAAGDEHIDLRNEHLRSWRRASGRMRANHLKVLVGRKQEDEHSISWGTLPQEDISPAQIISQYNYGDDIHWGKHRDAIDAFKSDPTFSANRRLDFFDAVEHLAHLYLGFGVLVGAARDEA